MGARGEGSENSGRVNASRSIGGVQITESGGTTQLCFPPRRAAGSALMLTIFGAACSIIGVMSVAGLERSGDSPASSNVALAFAGVFSLPLFAIGQLFIVIGFWTAVNSLAVEASAAGLRSTRRCFGIAVARRSMAHTDIAAIESRMAARYIGAFGRSRYYRLIASGRDPTHRSMLIADTLKGIEMTSEVRRIIVDRLAITGLDAAGRQDHLLKENPDE
jgi:hypothetical protein